MSRVVKTATSQCQAESSIHCSASNLYRALCAVVSRNETRTPEIFNTLSFATSNANCVVLGGRISVLPDGG